MHYRTFKTINSNTVNKINLSLVPHNWSGLHVHVFWVMGSAELVFVFVTCLISQVTTYGLSKIGMNQLLRLSFFFQVVDKVRSLERTKCGCCVHWPPVHGRFLFLLSRLSRGFSFNIQDSFRVFCSGLGAPMNDWTFLIVKHLLRALFTFFDCHPLTGTVGTG